MSYKFFLENVKKYSIYERIASEKLKNYFNVDSNIKFNNNFEYDIEYNGLYFEVKTDEASKETNNFFIEFEGYGKPTGITTTKANFYILNNTIKYYMIDINELKQMIADNKFRIVKTKDRLTSGFLISCNLIISNSVELI